MAFNTVSSAFLAILCIALTLAVKADEATSTEQNLPTSNVQSHYNVTSEEECNCVCGVSRNTRIVGGARAGRAEFPWLVAMFHRGSYYCGGSLITDRHVLTAAHCFVRIRYTDVTIQLGAYDIKDKTEKSLKRTIKRLTSHPDFNMSRGFDSDVAVIELDKPITFGSWNIGTACLPEETYHDYHGENATVVGRGRIKESGLVSGIPRKVDVPLMSMDTCRATGYTKNKISDNMLCAGYPNGAKDACQGDSGGPLNLRLNGTSMSTYEQVGIVSWGRGCARPNLPGVYTRIQKFLPWIRSKLTGGCECSRQ